MATYNGTDVLTPAQMAPSYGVQNANGTNVLTAAQVAPVFGTQNTTGTNIDWSGGGGSTTTYLMRAWGTVSSAYVYWVAAAPDGSGAPEVVTDPVLMKEIN